jgi:FAD/FMN-containing dehydrogenase
MSSRNAKSILPCVVLFHFSSWCLFDLKIKGGGHTSNAEFSSTKGIQISMVQFNDITYDSDKKTLTVGAGCLFDEVYRDKELNKARQNIVGGEDIKAIGVAGWLLGGGYSMKTNQFGLGIDNILAYKVVVPGKVGELPRLESVKSGDMEQNKKDLFWALKVASRIVSCDRFLND